MVSHQSPVLRSALDSSLMAEITSTRNSRVKAAVRLRERRHREKQQRIIIDGSREITRALDAGVQPVEAFVCEAMLDEFDGLGLIDRLRASVAEVHEATPLVFEKLSFGHRAEGVLLVAEMPRPTLEGIQPTEPALLGVVEGIEKPGNVGAVLRSADGAGLDAVVLASPGTDLFNPNAIRASLGTIFSMPVAAASTDELIPWLRNAGIGIVAARVDGSRPYTEIDFRRPTAIVLGSEAHGLSDAWQADDIEAVHLPMHGHADSLNVAATAAVLFYEAIRQRQT